MVGAYSEPQEAANEQNNVSTTAKGQSDDRKGEILQDRKVLSRRGSECSVTLPPLHTNVRTYLLTYLIIIIIMNVIVSCLHQ